MSNNPQRSSTTRSRESVRQPASNITIPKHNGIQSALPRKISQMKFDVSFIKRLLDKLKVGNSRSIHLNAIPGRSATRLDLYQLNNIDGSISTNFIETILNNDAFSFNISFDKIDLGKQDEEIKGKLAVISKRLNTLVIENTDNYLEFGLKNFGFGYPLLIKRDKNDPEKIIKAPIFIWHLDIDRSFQNKNSWTITKDEDSPITINQLLVSHLSKDESIKIENLPQDVLDDGVLDRSELLEICNTILSQLNAQSKNLEIKVEACLDAKQIDAIANSKPWIQWSGVFGIYRSQNETIIHATEELLKRIDEFKSEELVIEPFQTSTISAVETDPSKEEIVNTLNKDEIKLIQGPPGTGKSQSITAIVANALANNAKCLIVCEKKTALDVIQANLEKIGLGDYSAVIDDVNKDRKKIIEKARNIIESQYYSSFSKASFEDSYLKFCQLKSEINAKHAQALKKVFGDYTWTQLIGLYLKYSKTGDVDHINTTLNYSSFRFDHNEYSSYVRLLEDANNLYRELNPRLEVSFQLFDKSLFISEYKLATNQKVKELVNSFHTVIKTVCKFISSKTQDDFIYGGISIFNPTTLVECESYAYKAITELEEILKLYQKGTSLAGDAFGEIGVWRNLQFQLFSIIGPKNKEIWTLRKRISALSADVIKILNRMDGYDLNSVKLSNIESKTSFKHSVGKIPNTLVQLRVIKSQIEKMQNIQNLLESVESNLCVLNKERLLVYELPDYKKLGSQENLQDYYSELYNKIEQIKNNLSSYESYHNWSYFCSLKNEEEMRIIEFFKAIPIEEWKGLFLAWYYRGALLNFESNSSVGFHKSDTRLQSLSALYEDLSKQQIKQIGSIWGQKRMVKSSRVTYNFNTLYNLRKNNSGPKNSLRRIIAKDFDLFTTLFPVILTNPVAVNAIFPLEKGIFNIVIFDEASQLRVSDTFTSLIRVQYKVIAGDEHQMPPSSYFQTINETLDSTENEDESVFDEEDEQSILAESESLLQFATDLTNVNKSYLDFHYRSNHPALIDFSNNAFYGGNLVAFPAREVYKPIEFRAVNGRYESRTNPSEVAEIIKIIRDEIHTNNKGKYPSIGIATFNINQRNLITESLNEVAENDEEFANKLQELRKNGLFVKNLENIQGDEKDIIIISTTYGIKPDGTFSQNFARLNRIEGYKLLNVLITRAKHKLYVCTSIPKESYLTYSEIIKNEGNNKKGILYAYLAYAEAISNNNSELANSILSCLKTQSYEKPRVMSNLDGLSESPFEEEVYDMLIKYYPKDSIIQQHKVGGFRLDFVIKANNKDIVLECDGKAYHQSEEAYAHDMYRQKELEKMGFVIYRIWSTNWFQDKEVEMKKLNQFIGELND
ncbi:MAG: AAA domain-containing protein [Candidatus Roizmanbacteria bacterium]